MTKEEAIDAVLDLIDNMENCYNNIWQVSIEAEILDEIYNTLRKNNSQYTMVDNPSYIGYNKLQ